MWFVVIGVLVLLLKIGEVGPVAGLSWWWVGLPFLLAVLWWEFADKTGYTQRKAMDRLDERKAERVQRSLEEQGRSEKQQRRRKS